MSFKLLRSLKMLTWLNFQDVPVLLLQVGVVDGVEQGLVVLVHEDHRLPPRLFMGRLYQMDETFLHGLVLFLVPVQGLVFFEMPVYDVVQRLGVLIVFGVEVDVQHGIFNPLMASPANNSRLPWK